MSERYIIKDRWIFDTKLNKNIHSIDCYEEKNVLDIMNGQNERIAELEEQLKNSIRPRFKVGQSVWYYHIARNKTYEGIIDDIQWYATRQGLYYRRPQLQRDYFWIREDELFSTKAEAEAKLQELKGAVGND